MQKLGRDVEAHASAPGQELPDAVRQQIKRVLKTR
jgi:hypothetical protein